MLKKLLIIVSHCLLNDHGNGVFRVLFPKNSVDLVILCVRIYQACFFDHTRLYEFNDKLIYHPVNDAFLFTGSKIVTAK